MRLFFVLVFLVSSCTALKKPSHLKVFKMGHLFNSATGTWDKNQILVVRKGRIQAVNPSEIPAGVKVRDLSKNYVVPGLIDAHTHLYLDDQTMGEDFAQGLLQHLESKSDEARAELASERAKSLLAAGVTAVRDLGNQGELKTHPDLSPLLFVTSGPGYTPKLGQLPLGTPVATVLREYHLMKQRPDLSAFSYDVLKLYADEEPNHEITPPVLFGRWVRAGHEMGKKVAAHAIFEEAITTAVNAGVDTIEHGTEINSDHLKRMREKKIIFVPTLGDALFLLPELKLWKRRFHQDAFDKICGNLRKASEHNVEVALGSDNYFSPEGIDFGRATLLVLLSAKKCGWNSSQVLRALTFIPAKALGREKDIGSLSVGRRADFLVLEGNPTENLELLLEKKQVYVLGNRLKNPGP